MEKHILKKLIPFLLAVVMLLTVTPAVFATEEASEDVVILYVNDVHCGVDANSPEGSMGYANLAALKKELKQTHDYVTLVDAGDAIQGEAIGTLSDGSYLVDIMNYVGFDYAIYGNHEFDYGMDMALSLKETSNAQYLACNFEDLRTGELVTKPYSIAAYGDLMVAYVGIATPETFTKSTPTHFQDENGDYIYGFREGGNGQELYDAVQSAVDAATAEGANIVIALGHLGTDPASAPWRSYDVIANTTGLDAFIDGHSHSTIAGELVTNKDGENVLLTSTGTKMENIGKMTITPAGEITTELVSGYTNVDPDTDAYIKSIQSNFEDKLNEVVAKSDVELVVNDPVTGERIIRSRETNLGDLVADAYRVTLGADIGMVNGGGIRAAIQLGEITYGDLIAVHPYGNMMCVVEATGQEILDTLEVAAQMAPGENGSFQHVSGLKYTINTAIAPSVVMDDKGMLQSIGDTRRVCNVQVLGEDGTYAPIDPDATYTLASHNYMIKQGGSGVDHFMDNKLLADEVMIDNQVLIDYIRDELGGVVGQEYADPYGQGRITIIHTEPSPETADAGMCLPMAVMVICLLSVTALVKKKSF